MTDKKTCDLLIVGGGPAGLTAAIYATRRNLKTIVVSVTIGGQMALTNDIENYPGFDFIDGISLSNQMKEQATKWGTEFVSDEITEIIKKGEEFVAKSARREYEAKAIILAFGLTPRKLGVPGEEKFRGKGVSYCATCDGPLFKKKTVAIIGGGNSAMEAAEYLARLANHVYLINRSDAFRAEPYLLDKVKKLTNATIYCSTQVAEVKGQALVQSMIITDSQNQSKSEELKVDGIFIEIGYQPKTTWLKGVVELNSRGEIKVDRDGNTSTKGIFAAGDCTDVHYKQIAVSTGEGTKAALQVYKYLVAKDGRITVPDWGKCELVGTEKQVDIKLEK